MMCHVRHAYCMLEAYLYMRTPLLMCGIFFHKILEPGDRGSYFTQLLIIQFCLLFIFHECYIQLCPQVARATTGRLAFQTVLHPTMMISVGRSARVGCADACGLRATPPKRAIQGGSTHGKRSGAGIRTGHRNFQRQETQTKNVKLQTTRTCQASWASQTKPVYLASSGDCIASRPRDPTQQDNVCSGVQHDNDGYHITARYTPTGGWDGPGCERFVRSRGGVFACGGQWT